MREPHAHVGGGGGNRPRPPRVAFQGELAAFGEEAIARLWPGGALPLPAATFDDVARMVAAGAAEAGVLPVENAIAGPVAAACLTLTGWSPPLHAAAEAAVTVRLCLLGLPGTAPPDIRAARSHPVALAQCGAFFHAHQHIRPVPSHDTAGAAREVAELGDPAVAAIASLAAAERYGLAVLAAAIQDRPDNFTRFVAISRGAPAPPARGSPTRTLLSFSAPRLALRTALAPFATRHIPARPLLTLPNGLFLLQLDHPAAHPSVEAALTELIERVGGVRVVGSYEV